MFWSDRGATNKIEVATLAGEKRETFLAKGLANPRGLTLDFDNDM